MPEKKWNVLAQDEDRVSARRFPGDLARADVRSGRVLQWKGGHALLSCGGARVARSAQHVESQEATETRGPRTVNCRRTAPATCANMRARQAWVR